MNEIERKEKIIWTDIKEKAIIFAMRKKAKINTYEVSPWKKTESEMRGKK